MASEALPKERPPRVLRGFSLGDYEALIRELLEFGYRDVGLEELRAREQTMFLRHDVDLSLERAVTLAEAEQALQVSATYYVLVSTDQYNPAHAASRRAMEKIIRLGHDIGLHFDATQYEGKKAEQLEQAAAEECAILEALTGAPVRSIAFHVPTPELLALRGNFAGRLHTYDPRFVADIGYISDSAGGWYYGHPLDHPAVQAGSAIQLLTHPIWWCCEERTSPEREIERLRRERLETMESGLAVATSKAPKNDET